MAAAPAPAAPAPPAAALTPAAAPGAPQQGLILACSLRFFGAERSSSSSPNTAFRQCKSRGSAPVAPAPRLRTRGQPRASQPQIPPQLFHGPRVPDARRERPPGEAPGRPHGEARGAGEAGSAPPGRCTGLPHSPCAASVCPQCDPGAPPPPRASSAQEVVSKSDIFPAGISGYFKIVSFADHLPKESGSAAHMFIRKKG